ncbi:coiled-coil domain-containing protein 9 isoform 2-T9 [Thomomys bottae]
MAATLDLKSKEEKDSELDKRIEALRRKNEALIRRYQEIEEDRKKAELEGVAVTAPRKGRSLEKEPVVDLEKGPGPPRRPPGVPRPSGANRGGRPPPRQGGRASLGRGPHGWEDCSGEQPRRAGGRGRRGRGRGSPHLSGAGDASTSDRRSKEWEERRRQNIEKMNEEMEKIAEYERNQREGVLEPNPVRNFLDDPRRRSGPPEEPERDRREGSRRHGRNWGGTDFERVRCGLEQERQGRRAGLGGAGDMTLSMTGRERSEYLRWKQEREKIDQERLQRHRKPTGQWRREWDAEKTEGMFKDGPPPAHSHEAPVRHDDQAWARPPKPPTFGEFLSQHKAEVSNRRRRKNSRPQAKAVPRAYSDHDDRWEMKEEAVSPAPEASPPPTPQEPPVQPPKTQPPVHRPPEDEGEEDGEGEEEGEEDDDDNDGAEEDEEWEDVSEDVTEDDEEEEEEIEEEGGAEAPEQAQARDPSILEAEPIRDPTPDEADPVPPRPQEPEEPQQLEEPQEPGELSPAPATPSSPFSTPTGHQPVPDWGGDQPAPASLESGPSLPGAQKAEEEGSEATPEAGPEETAEITDFHGVRFCKVVAAAPLPGAAR